MEVFFSRQGGGCIDVYSDGHNFNTTGEPKPYAYSYSNALETYRFEKIGGQDSYLEVEKGDGENAEDHFTEHYVSRLFFKAITDVEQQKVDQMLEKMHNLAESQSMEFEFKILSRQSDIASMNKNDIWEKVTIEKKGSVYEFSNQEMKDGMLVVYKIDNADENLNMLEIFVKGLNASLEDAFELWDKINEPYNTTQFPDPPLPDSYLVEMDGNVRENTQQHQR